MKRIKRLWLNIPRKTRIAINLLAIFLLCFALYIFLGCPTFTPEQRYRRAERTHMVGPAKILGIYDSESPGYQYVLVADEGDGVIFYLYSDVRGSKENLYYREKTGDLTVLAAPNIPAYSSDAQVLNLPVFLFDNYPEAVRAELEFTLSETVNDVYFEKTYRLESTREEDGYFHFNIHAEAPGTYTDEYGFEHSNELGAEAIVLSQFSQMCGYADSFNLRPQPITVRLWDEKDELILEEEILVHCVAGQAHTEQGEEFAPKEHKRAAG